MVTVEEDGHNVSDDDGEIDSEMEPFLLQCASFATFQDGSNNGGDNNGGSYSEMHWPGDSQRREP